jgi:hypothetical protein
MFNYLLFKPEQVRFSKGRANVKTIVKSITIRPNLETLKTTLIAG